MNLMFLILAFIFAGVILVLGYIENYKKKGYNMPFDEDKPFVKKSKHQVRTPWKK